MSERVHAAANQIDYGLGVGAPVETIAKDALNAADAVMFSAGNIERAIERVTTANGLEPGRAFTVIVYELIEALKTDEPVRPHFQ